MNHKNLQFDPMALAKALAIMNFVFGILLLVAFGLLGMDMKTVGWRLLLAAPFLLSVAGFLYGLVGGKVYVLLTQKKDFLLESGESESAA